MNPKLKIILKFLIFIIFLPFTVLFIKNSVLTILEFKNTRYLFTGMGIYCFFYLFLDRMRFFFDFNKKAVEKIFYFFQPFIKVAYFIVPLFVIIIACIQIFLNLYEKLIFDSLLLGLLGFFFGLHVILSCNAIRPKKASFMEVNYLFGLTFIFLFSFSVLLLCLKPFFDLSMVGVFDVSFSELKALIVSLYSQLFVPEA